MKEDLIKALHSAQLLCAELQAAHSHACADNPTVEQRLAESHLLSLLADAVKLRQALEGVASCV